MTPLRLTVGMPNFNQARYLEQAIRAVAEQSRPPDEFIITDDGSTDESPSIIERLAGQYPFIRYIRHRKNQGLTVVLREQLKLATGAYIYFTGSDDQVLPDFFLKVMRAAERHPQAGFIAGKIISTDPEGRRFGVVEIDGWQTDTYADPAVFLREYVDRETPMHSLSGATVYRKEALEAVGGFRFEELGHWCDTFAFRAVGLRFGGVYLPEFFLQWTVRRGSISQSVFRDSRRMRQIIDRACDLMRSPEFSPYFPEASVLRWRKKYLRFVRFYCNPLALGATGLLMRGIGYAPVGPLVRAGQRIVRRLTRA